MKTEKLIPTEITKWLEQQAAHSEIKVSVVVPAFNEQRRLPPTLIDMIDYLDRYGDPYEIIVVDDGSSDDTTPIVEKFEKIRPQVRHIRLPRNKGKGYAVKTGVLSSRGALVLFADADGATPIIEFERLATEIAKGAEVAIGSRAMHSKDTVVTTRWYRKYLGRMFNYVVNTALLPGIADTQCGFKLFTASAARSIFQHQQAEGYSFDVELLYIARKLELKISEVPINWHNVPGSKVNLFVDALIMLKDTLVFRFRHRGLRPEDL